MSSKQLDLLGNSVQDNQNVLRCMKCSGVLKIHSVSLHFIYFECLDCKFRQNCTKVDYYLSKKEGIT